MKAGATILPWILVAFFVSSATATVKPTFKDVSRRRGLLSLDQMDVRNYEYNKYWGSTIADLDRDGKYDLLMSNHGNNPELYFMRGNMMYSFRNVNMPTRDMHATAAADMDNDGYFDFVMNVGGRNGADVSGRPIVHVVGSDQSIATERGRKKYSDIMGLGDVPQRGRAMMFVDINTDGYLDLLLLNQKNISADSWHMVYENLGDGTFRLRRNTGIESVKGFYGQVIDANNDSYPDILLFGWNPIRLVLGTGKFRFEDGSHVLPSTASHLTQNGRCVAEIDYDGDGDLDFILARGAYNVDTPRTQDILFEKRGGRFVQAPIRGKLGTRNHFHVTVGDFNNDGHTDMYFSVMTHFEKPREPDWMYLNEGDGSFSLALRHGTESTKPDSDGDNANAFDYNLDGRLDLLVGGRNESWKLYENQSSRGSNHFLLVRVGEPRGQIAEPQWFRRKALGALVKVFCGSKVFLQRVGSPGQSHSQSYMDTLHFGLGKCGFVDSLEVHYPGEVVVKRSGVKVDEMVTIGMYFPCPAGRLGLGCNEVMKACSAAGCRGGKCETIELIGSKCEEHQAQNCENPTPPGPEETPVPPEPEETPAPPEPEETAAPPEPEETSAPPEPEETPVPPGSEETPVPPGPELLENGSFEDNAGWELIGHAAYSYVGSSQGPRSVQLALGKAEVRQTVHLDAGREYTLKCDEWGSAIIYEVQSSNAGASWKTSDDPEDTVEDSEFKSKKLTFRPKKTGAYKIIFSSRFFESGFIDNCQLHAFDDLPDNESDDLPDNGSDDLPDNGSDDMLANGGFEGEGWEFTGGARVRGEETYDGKSALVLPFQYSYASQTVFLSKGLEYVMQCYELTGAVKYKILKGGNNVVARDSRLGNKIPGSNWRTKKMRFKVNSAGVYEIRVSTDDKVFVDMCSLKKVTGGTMNRLQETPTEIRTRRQTDCGGSCLKLYCPV